MKIPSELINRPKSQGSFIKATNIDGLKHGNIVDFVITSDVQVKVQGDPPNQKNLYSCGVEGTFKDQKLEGLYNLNVSSIAVLGSVLGDESENWIGARFKAMAVPTRNPQTNAQTSTLSILADSVKSAKTR